MLAVLIIVVFYSAFTSAIQNASVSENFTIWDFCSNFSTECSLPLGTTRYAFGSAHEPGSSSWYLIGGTGQSMTEYNFVTEDSVIVVDLPADVSSFESLCGTEYPQDLPFGLGQGAGAAINGTLYSFGGFSGSPDRKYIDGVFDSDIESASSFSSSLTSMPDPISAACSVAVGHRVYIIGGLNNGTITDEVFMFDVSTDSWTEMAPMTIGRFAAGCAYFDGRIFVFGGQSGGGEWGFGPELNSTEIYDIAQDSWEESDATLSRSAHWITATLLFLSELDLNVILVMGGISGMSDVSDGLDVYDIASDSIVQSTRMMHRRYAFHAIAPSHGGWGRQTAVIAGGKNGVGEVLSTVDAIYCGTTESTPSATAAQPTVEPTNDLTAEEVTATDTGFLGLASWSWSTWLVLGVVAAVLFLVAVGVGCCCHRKFHSAVPTPHENDAVDIMGPTTHAVVVTATSVDGV